MDRRAFMAALAGAGLSLAAAPALAALPRHEVINIETSTSVIGIEDGKVKVSLSTNAEEASARLLALKGTMRPGDTVAITFNGEIIGTFTA